MNHVSALVACGVRSDDDDDDNDDEDDEEDGDGDGNMSLTSARTDLE